MHRLVIFLLFPFLSVAVAAEEVTLWNSGVVELPVLWKSDNGTFGLMAGANTNCIFTPTQSSVLVQTDATVTLSCAAATNLTFWPTDEWTLVRDNYMYHAVFLLPGLYVADLEHGAIKVLQPAQVASYDTAVVTGVDTQVRWDKTASVNVSVRSLVHTQAPSYNLVIKRPPRQVQGSVFSLLMSILVAVGLSLVLLNLVLIL